MAIPNDHSNWFLQRKKGKKWLISFLKRKSQKKENKAHLYLEQSFQVAVLISFYKKKEKQMVNNVFEKKIKKS